MGFYDDIADEYDAITGAEDRSPRAEAFVRELTSRYKIRSAIDAACGTGLYSVPLARCGVCTVGADISQEMLDKAARSVSREGLEIRWLCSPMQDLGRQPSLPAGRFDAVLCMGNSIPHILTDDDLGRTMDGFARLLRPGGIAVFQLLNYARVLAEGERIVGINRLGSKEYVRFYDFLPGRVRFNILEIDWSTSAATHRLHVTELRPYRAAEIAGAMQACGFGKAALFAGLSLVPFDESKDETVTVLGTRV